MPSKVYLNDGDGTFRDSGQDLDDTDLNGTDVNLFDVDQDGDLDALAVYHQAPNRVYLNDGNGVFTASGRSFPEGTIWGDLDSDGDMDAFIKERGQGYKTMLDDGAGNFTDHWQLEDSGVLYGKVALGDLDLVGTEGAIRCTLGDLDDDGDLDVFADFAGGANEIWFNLTPMEATSTSP
jgi:hypothetical protein